MIVDTPDGRKAEFPDDLPIEKVKEALAKKFPITGEGIAAKMEADPNYIANSNDFEKWKTWRNENTRNFAESVFETIKTALATAPDVVKNTAEGIYGTLKLPTLPTTGEKGSVHTGVEGARQALFGLYGLMAESDKPDSWAFKLKDKVLNGFDGAKDGGYKQYVDARKYAIEQKALNEGGAPGVLPKWYDDNIRSLADPKLAEKVSILTPIPGFEALGELAKSGVLGEGALKAAQSMSRVQGLAGDLAAKSAEKTGGAMASTAGAATGAIEKGLGAIKDAAKDSIPAGIGIGMGATHIPYLGVAGKAYLGAKGIEAAGQLIGEAGRLAQEPSRLGVLERLGESQNLGSVAKYGAKGLAYLDPAVQALSPIAGGAAEGAAIGGALGYFNSGDTEGTGRGMGTGLALGAISGAGASALKRLGGNQDPNVVRYEAGKEIASLSEAQKPLAEKLFSKLLGSGDREAVAEFIDSKNLLKDIADFHYVDNETAKQVFEANFPGKQYVDSQGFAGTSVSGKPAVYINVDNAKAGVGYHEAFHGVLRTAIGEEFGQKLGQWAAENLPPERIKSYVDEYINRVPENQRASLRASLDVSTPDGIKNAIEEVGAKQFSKFLQSPAYRDYLLRGKQDLGGVFIGLANDLVGSITDRLGVSDYKAQKTFGALAKELINARKHLVKGQANDGTQPRPFDVTGKTPVDLEKWAAQNGQTDVLQRDPTGKTVGLKSEAQVEQDRAGFASRMKEIRDIALKSGGKENAAGDKGVKLNRRMLEKNLDKFPPDKYRRISALLGHIEDGDTIDVHSYWPKTKRVEGSTAGVYTKRGEVSKTVVPYEVAITRQGDLLLRVLDVGMLKNRAEDYFLRPGNLDPWQGDIKAANADLVEYLHNLHKGEDSKPTAEILGKAKRDALYKVVGGILTVKQKEALRTGNLDFNEPSTGRNTANETIKGKPDVIGVPGYSGHTRPFENLTINDMGDFSKNSLPYKFNLGAHEKAKVNWLPSEPMKDGEVIGSKEGYRIIHGSKWRLYGKDNALIGVYDSEGEATKRAEKLAK